MKQGLNRRLVSLSSACLGFAILCVTSPAFGAQTVVAYDPDPSKGEFPVSVAVDWLGNKYVSLQPICEVRRYDAHWRPTHTFTLPCDKTNGDMGSGLVVEPWGTFYAAIANREGRGHQGVYEVQPWGAMRRLPGTEKMRFPNSLAFDHLFGTLYVTDYALGQVWSIRPHRQAEVWSDAPELKSTIGMAANGLAVHGGYAIVSISQPVPFGPIGPDNQAPQLVRIPIERDGSAGKLETLVMNSAFGKLSDYGFVAVDDITLDAVGNIYVSGVFPWSVLRVSPDGKEIVKVAAGPADGLPSPVVSLAFDNCWEHGPHLLVAINPGVGAGGAGSAILRIDLGLPGQPLSK
jgi:hypothetical protein